MNLRSPTQTQTKPSSFIPVPTGLLQRKCADCGQHVSSRECSKCSQKQHLLQRHTTNYPESLEVPQFLFPDARDHLHVKAVPCRI